MQFNHTSDLVISGAKTQTRRIVKPEHTLIGIGEFASVMNARGLSVYAVGKTYAVQSGRTAKGIARIRITDIRHEDVRNISDEDVKAEGFGDYLAFMKTWLGMHDKAVAQYLPEKMNPVSLVNNRHGIRDWLMMQPAEKYQAWVLTFELSAAAGITDTPHREREG